MVSLTAAFFLIAVLGFRIATRVDLWQWWIPVVFLGGMATADFASGLVHWGADTWGRDDLPIIGNRLLTPFRLHHINPDDFLGRSFVDTNSDVAFVAVPVLFALVTVPLEAVSGAAMAIFGFGFCGVGMLTNQIHQWAHRPSPPPPICVLQNLGLILGRAHHAAHHDRPYHLHYCITTGWCNRPLEAIGFFRRLETAITVLTGAQPREDDRRYEASHG